MKQCNNFVAKGRGCDCEVAIRGNYKKGTILKEDWSKDPLWLRAADTTLSAADTTLSNWDGTYNSRFLYKMGSDSICPEAIPIEIEIVVKDSEVTGYVLNQGKKNLVKVFQQEEQATTNSFFCNNTSYWRFF